MDDQQIFTSDEGVAIHMSRDDERDLNDYVELARWPIVASTRIAVASRFGGFQLVCNYCGSQLYGGLDEQKHIAYLQMDGPVFVFICRNPQCVRCNSTEYQISELINV